MKKILVSLTSLALIAFSFSAQALSVDAQTLKDKLATFDNLNASFEQRVTSSEGTLLNESSGEVIISRPGKFHWQVQIPEEELIVSNGETIWFYSPFIEQVTLINFAEAITNTPFVLLSGATQSQWENYAVSQNKDLFMVSSVTEAQAPTFIFEFNQSGNINKFVVVEEQGQRSEFTLTHKEALKNVDETIFEFIIPEGVEVDDQR